MLSQCIDKINSLDRLKGERNAYVNKNNVYHYTTYISILSQAREKKKSVHFKSSTNCTRAICTSRVMKMRLGLRESV